MKALQVLKNVRKTLSDPEQWTKGVGARNANENPTMTTALDACKWCVLGALGKSTHEIYPHEYMVYEVVTEKIMQILKPKWSCISDFNDAFMTTHEDVMRVLDAAIELLSEQAVAEEWR